MNYDTEKCFLFNKNGYLVKEDKLFQKLGLDYYRLLCVIKGDINVEEMIFPQIKGSNREMLLQKSGVAMLAEKSGIKYLETTGIISPGKRIIIIFKPKNKEDAVIYKYLTEKHHPKIQFDKVYYLYNYLNGQPEDLIRGRFIFKYIHRYFPDELFQKFDKIDLDQKMTTEQKYKKKYQLIEKYDNFKDFNQKYKQMREEALKFLKIIKKSKDFQQYLKKVKILKFVFDLKDAIGNNPLYNHKLEKEMLELRKK